MVICSSQIFIFQTVFISLPIMNAHAEAESHVPYPDITVQKLEFYHAVSHMLMTA